MSPSEDPTAPPPPGGPAPRTPEPVSASGWDTGAPALDDPYAAEHRAPGWQPPAPPHEPTAIAALVTGLLALGPAAVALGVAGLVRTRRAGTRGRGMAVAGVALGAFWTLALVGVGVAVAMTVAQQRPLAADVDAPRDAHVQQLVTGSCLAELPADGPVERVRVVPCAQPHAAQVVSTFQFSPAAVWGGQDAADSRVAQGCTLTDEERAAGVTLVTWAPTEAGWRRGDRTGLCLAVPPAPVTGSFTDGTATPAP